MQSLYLKKGFGFQDHGTKHQTRAFNKTIESESINQEFCVMFIHFRVFSFILHTFPFDHLALVTLSQDFIAAGLEAELRSNAVTYPPTEAGYPPEWGLADRESDWEEIVFLLRGLGGGFSGFGLIMHVLKKGNHTDVLCLS